MSEVVHCPTCGGPARASRTETSPSGTPVLTAVTDEERSDKIAQLKEVVRLQKERLDAANQRVRDLEETLRQGTLRPGIKPATPDAPPSVPGRPNITFQGKAGVF